MPRPNPRNQWSEKEERQYDAIKASKEVRGTSNKRASEIAARTVNKQRAQAGKTQTASKSSIQDMSAYKRGGRRSGKRSGPKGRTKEQLYQDAKRRGVKGRSKMNKAELQRALGDK
ncbi:plasmid stabilization protein [Salininema proteolyticum]|uniref:Plasmid stabilization protein n=1 Tax=Salininema proteolyticum TaxID=1607685 RepID=A0ABV8U5J3_9ACTN